MNVDKPSKTFLNVPGFRRTMPGADKNANRLPGSHSLPDKVRNHFVAVTGEFIGTFLFLFFAFSGTQIANSAVNGANLANPAMAVIPNVGALIYISLAFGFSLAVNAWVFFRISGGLFNPAVTLGMALIGAVPWLRAGLIMVSQILGAICSAAVVSCLFPQPLLASTTLGATTSVVQGLFIEMFLTAELVFTIFMLAAEKHKGTFIAPLGIGLSLFIAELTGVWFTGGSLNPARSFGPCVVLTSFPGYHWIYWVGPGLGALLAAGFYRFVKMLEFETANPGQDHDREEAETFKYDSDPTIAAGSRSMDTRRSTESSPERFRHPASARRAAASPSPGPRMPAPSADRIRSPTGLQNSRGVNVLTPHEEKAVDEASFRNASDLESGGVNYSASPR